MNYLVAAAAVVANSTQPEGPLVGVYQSEYFNDVITTSDATNISNALFLLPSVDHNFFNEAAVISYEIVIQQIR